MSKRRSSSRPSSRQPAQRVRTARQRSLSSTLWLQRQLNDPYVAEAKQQGYRSRAAFKLLGLDDRFKLLKPGLRVVDLGAAPGGWTQVSVQRVDPDHRGGQIVALDILPMDPIPGATILTADFTDDSAPDLLRAELGGPVDLVLSDLAPATTGHRPTDHLRIIGLVELAADFAEAVLAPGGAFVAKVFQGGTEGELLKHLKQVFQTVRHAKPPASRSESAETYLVATGFRGRADTSDADGRNGEAGDGPV